MEHAAHGYREENKETQEIDMELCSLSIKTACIEVIFVSILSLLIDKQIYL